MVYGLGLGSRVQGSGCSWSKVGPGSRGLAVSGPGFRVLGWFKVGPGFRGSGVQGLGFRVVGVEVLGSRVLGVEV